MVHLAHCILMTALGEINLSGNVCHDDVEIDDEGGGKGLRATTLLCVFLATLPSCIYT